MPDDRTRSGDHPTAADTREAREPTATPQPRAARPPLTPDDVRRLTLYKWRYSLESFGFSAEEIGHLLFLKWLHATGAIRG